MRGGYAQILVKYYAILHVGLEHLNKFLWDSHNQGILRGNCAAVAIKYISIL